MKVDSIDVVVTFDGENQQIEAVVHEDLKIKKRVKKIYIPSLPHIEMKITSHGDETNEEPKLHLV